MLRSDDRDRPSRSLAWPFAVTVITVVAIIAATVVFVFQSLKRIPSATVEQAQEVLTAVQDLASAFRQGTIETRFTSYATTISGSKHLQFATLKRTEVFTREDRSSIFWGALELPEVMVSATAPVEYTAYLDFDEPWELRLEDRTLQVTAPKIRFNRPAIDASQIEYEVRQGSLLRDEESVMQELKRGLTSMSILRTRELTPLVRETGRHQVEDFVRTWLLQSFPEATDVSIEVAFADEAEPLSPLLREAPTD